MALLSFLVGFVDGLRSLTAPAILCWAAHFGWLHFAGTRFAFIDHPVTRTAFTLLAIAELIVRLTPPATPGGAWTYRVLHAFTGRFDGQAPRGALILGGKGVLYGTSGGGGAYAGGMVFQFVPPTVPGGTWSENVLCSFGSATGDGEGPTANVIFDSAGNIYGITAAGGTSNGGTVFQCAPPASLGGDWTETVLHSFGQGNAKDGSVPSGGLTLGKNGVLFGVTQNGGTNGEGTTYGVVK